VREQTLTSLEPYSEPCGLCAGATRIIELSYAECAHCDILISRTAAASYDEDYYYFKANARSRDARKRAEMLWRQFSRYIDSCACLDFGCNDGSFVEVAARNGARCEGTDVNERALALAKAFGRGSFWSPRDLSGRKFRCVTAFDVIEHFDILDDFFEVIDAYLEDSGLLIVTTPNKNSKWRRIYGDGWHGFGIPRYHRFIMSERSLRRQLRLHAFEVEEVFSSAPIAAKGWKLLVASGYRLKNGVAAKIAALPMAVAKFMVGRALVGGEEDTLCVVARKVQRPQA
jgi:SAM-dependent methyltransferase